MKNLIVLFFVLMAFVSCSKNDDTKTPPPDLINMNQVLEDFIAAHPNVPSISMAAVKDGEVIYSYGAGFYDVDGTKTPDENTLYVTSSMAKLIVAVAVMQQVEQGALDIDDDVSNYIGFQVRNPNFPETVITTRMLMQHSASLANPNFGEVIDDVFFGYEPDSIIQLHPLIEDIVTPGSPVYMETIWMNAEPGTVYKNSNYGITMLGYLVEHLSGQHFNDYSKTNIFEPLGMDHSSYYYPDLAPDN
ncbi:MAG: beta-lactamase family protein, partial [Sinomicrobium sp.]|nr:beta-lactamase family protein [Sinomicrobium sp.]